MPRTAQTGRAKSVAAPKGGGGWLKGLIVVLVIAGVLAAAAFWAINKLGNLSIFHSSGCTATSTAGSTDLDLDQAKYASTIAAVGVSMNVPAFGIRVAEATAMQESKLHDVTYGDRDSLGLFQQRPSQGWGTSQQILDPVYATTRFYRALLNVPNWQALSLTAAAQAVQHSGSPTAYAQHEQPATVVTSVFSGTATSGLGCTLDGPTFPAQSKGADRLLVARGQSVVDEMRAEFGTANVGKITGIAADGKSFGVAAPTGVVGGQAATREWSYANWLAAQAESMGIAQVSYDGKTWSASDGGSGWKADGSAYAISTSVHVVLVSGG
ncbi:MAG: hypothetical protein ACRDVE_15340 [Actinocrinis sp.]